MIEGFILGAISVLSWIAALFFLKYWRTTRDKLFLAFAVAFVIEGVNRASYLFINYPNESMPINYVVRLAAFLAILAAIIQKNFRNSTSSSIND